MKIRVLGCDGGHLPGFSTVSFLINDHLVLDAGSVASALSIKEQQKIQHMLITHGHLDHIKELPFLGENVFLSGSYRSIQVYASEAILTDITKNIFNGIVWPNLTKIPKQTPIFSFRSIKKTLTLGKLKIQAIPVDHSHAALGYIISDKSGSVVFSGDTGPTKALWEATHKLKKLKAIFIELSYPAALLDFAWETRHMSTASILRELAKTKNNKVPVYFYHLKPPYFQKISAEVKQFKNKRYHILRPNKTLNI